MKLFTANLAAVAVLSGCGTDSGPSLDQQQKAWEEDIERNTCEMWHEVGEDYFTLQQSLDTVRTGRQAPVQEPRLGLAGCHSETFGKVLYGQIDRQFESSPKGQAGETMAPPPPR